MNKKIRNSIYFIGLAILCSLFIFSTFNIASVIKKRQNQQQDILYNYQKNGNIEYKIYLNKNDFIKDQYLNQNQYYLSQLVDYVATTFNYRFAGDKNTELEYSYYIKGILTGSYTDGSQGSNVAKIWTKEYDLKNAVTKITKDKEFVINENLNLDLVSYNLEVEKFKQALGIPITAELTIQFNITVNGTIDNKKFSEKDVIYMEIPIDTIVFSIDGPYNVFDAGKVLRDDAIINIANNETIMNGVLFIVSLLLVIIIIKKVLFDDNKTPYQVELDNILNQYGNRVVIVKNFLNISQDRYVNITTFNELIDLVDELNIPILCLIHNNRELHETWFIVINDKLVYRYILRPNK
jgi:hypothetical protein